jgi:predicted nucleic-acid-binding protein
MIGLDTNILVRYLTQDDPIQAAEATRMIEEAVANEESLFINDIVLCELVWVLEAAYGFPKQEVLDALDSVFRTRQFEFEDKDTVWRALEDFRRSSADFSDCLVGRKNKARTCSTTRTFDRAAGELDSYTPL